MNPRGTPQRVLPAHPPDQVTQAAINLWPPCPVSRFPSPKQSKASAMPPQDGFRLNHMGLTEEVWPELGHLYKKRTVTAAQPKTGWCPPQSDVELMAEKQILSFEPVPRLEQV